MKSYRGLLFTSILFTASIVFAQDAGDTDRIGKMKEVITRINAVHKNYEEIRKGLTVASERAIKEAGPEATVEKIAAVKAPFDKYLKEVNEREAKEIKALEDKLAEIQNPLPKK